MECSDKPTLRTIGVHLAVAMALQYFGIGMWMLAPGNPNKGFLYNATPPLLFITPAVLVTIRAGWLLHRPSSDNSKAWSLWLTLPFCLVAVFLVPVLFFELIFLIVEH